MLIYYFYSSFFRFRFLRIFFNIYLLKIPNLNEYELEFIQWIWIGFEYF